MFYGQLEISFLVLNIFFDYIVHDPMYVCDPNILYFYILINKYQ